MKTADRSSETPKTKEPPQKFRSLEQWPEWVEKIVDRRDPHIVEDMGSGSIDEAEDIVIVFTVAQRGVHQFRLTPSHATLLIKMLKELL